MSDEISKGVKGWVCPVCGAGVMIGRPFDKPKVGHRWYWEGRASDAKVKLPAPPPSVDDEEE